MKKLSLLLILCLLLTSVVGCGGEKAVEAPAEPAAETPADPAADPAAEAEEKPVASGKFDDGYPENVLRLGLQGELESADVQLTTADYTIPMNIYDCLFEVQPKDDGSSEIVGNLATDFEVSDDGLVYTMHLREGVKFHNGEILTSDDVLYTVDRMLNPERMARNSDSMSMLKGFDAAVEGEIPTMEGEGIVIIDDNTFEFHLTKAFSPFLANLCVPGFSIYNREAGDAADEAGGGIDNSQFGVLPEYTIGTGAFMMKDWVLNDHIYIEKNPDYWKGPSKLDGILFKIVPDNETRRMMFESGQLDEFDLDDAREQIPYYMESAEWEDNVIIGNRVGTFYYHINESIAPFENVLVRKAMQHAIDKQAILDSLYGGAGEVASGILAPGMMGYNADLPKLEYDPDLARELLAEAGYADGFEMTISQTTDSPNTLSLNEIVQAQLAEFGIEVTIDQMDEASWFDVRRTGALPMYTTSWSADFNDPDNFLYSFFTPANSLNRSFNYYNTDAMARVEAARYMLDHDARMQEYQDLEKLIIQDDAAWIPLFHLKHIWVVSDRVNNYVPFWAGWSGANYWGVYLD